MSFGRELRRIRGARHLSQHDLAGITGVSQRHLSYLESGKSNPSRGMVVLLGRALSVPLGQQNGLLLAAGFAPAVAEQPLDDPAFSRAREAMTFVLDRHEPCPAIALDRGWTVLAANRGMGALIGFLATGDPSQPVNIEGADFLESLVVEGGVSRYLKNAERAACNTLERIHRDAVGAGDDALRARVEGLLSRYDRAAIHDAAISPTLLPSVDFVRDGTSLRFLSIMVAFTTPCAIELAAIKIEIFYPADDDTQKLIARWAGPARGPPGEQ